MHANNNENSRIGHICMKLTLIYVSRPSIYNILIVLWEGVNHFNPFFQKKKKKEEDINRRFSLSKIKISHLSNFQSNGWQKMRRLQRAAWTFATAAEIFQLKRILPPSHHQPPAPRWCRISSMWWWHGCWAVLHPRSLPR